MSLYKISKNANWITFTFYSLFILDKRENCLRCTKIHSQVPSKVLVCLFLRSKNTHTGEREKNSNTQKRKNKLDFINYYLLLEARYIYHLWAINSSFLAKKWNKKLWHNLNASQNFPNILFLFIHCQKQNKVPRSTNVTFLLIDSLFTCDQFFPK